MAQAGSDGGKELEYKFRVDSQEQLDGLVGHEGGHAGAAVRQVNHFFDTKDHALNAPPTIRSGCARRPEDTC
jgi:hypothetical protein